MTVEEIARLLEACAPFRRLLLETAFVTGLRAKELRNLTVHPLDRQRCGLHLDAAWTKNRKPGFQPLPLALGERLHVFAGQARALYEKHYGAALARSAIPAQPLLHVPSHPARSLDADLDAAGIPKVTPPGKLDFHAVRLAYINLVIESGVTVKEAQVLARHETPELAMNTYGRAREERLWTVVEQVAQAIRVISVSRPEGAITADDTKALMSWQLRDTGRVEAAGIEPADPVDTRLHNPTTFPTKSQQNKTLGATALSADKHYQTIAEHKKDSFLHAKCVICVSDFPGDLATVVAAWDSLPAAVKAGIVAMVTVARQS